MRLNLMASRNAALAALATSGCLVLASGCQMLTQDTSPFRIDQVEMSNAWRDSGLDSEVLENSFREGWRVGYTDGREGGFRQKETRKSAAFESFQAHFRSQTIADFERGYEAGWQWAQQPHDAKNRRQASSQPGGDLGHDGNPSAGAFFAQDTPNHAASPIQNRPIDQAEYHHRELFELSAPPTSAEATLGSAIGKAVSTMGDTAAPDHQTPSSETSTGDRWSAETDGNTPPGDDSLQQDFFTRDLPPESQAAADAQRVRAQAVSQRIDASPQRKVSANPYFNATTGAPEGEELIRLPGVSVGRVFANQMPAAARSMMIAEKEFAAAPALVPASTRSVADGGTVAGKAFIDLDPGPNSQPAVDPTRRISVQSISLPSDQSLVSSRPPVQPPINPVLDLPELETAIQPQPSGAFLGDAFPSSESTGTSIEDRSPEHNAPEHRTMEPVIDGSSETNPGVDSLDSSGASEIILPLKAASSQFMGESQRIERQLPRRLPLRRRQQ